MKRERYCLEVYVPDLTIDQRDQLMVTICEVLHRREIGIASNASDVEAMVAARVAGPLEVEQVAKTPGYRAIAFPKRNGEHELLRKDS